MKPFGADPKWHKNKTYVVGEDTLLLYPETNFSPDNIHVHDYLAGGPISLNMWHTLFITSQYGNAPNEAFLGFNKWVDVNGAPYEAPEGTVINDLRNPSDVYEDYTGDAIHVPKYLPVWQFLYSADKIEARYGAVA